VECDEEEQIHRERIATRGVFRRVAGECEVIRDDDSYPHAKGIGLLFTNKNRRRLL
jgi:hypothetical protein